MSKCIQRLHHGCLEYIWMRELQNKWSWGMATVSYYIQQIDSCVICGCVSMKIMMPVSIYSHITSRLLGKVQPKLKPSQSINLHPSLEVMNEALWREMWQKKKDELMEEGWRQYFISDWFCLVNCFPTTLLILQWKQTTEWHWPGSWKHILSLMSFWYNDWMLVIAAPNDQLGTLRAFISQIIFSAHVYLHSRSCTHGMGSSVKHRQN